MGEIKVHSAMGADDDVIARDLMDTGIIVLDDPGGTLFDVVFDGIYDALGHWADGRDLIEEKYDTPIGPAWVIREEGRVSRKKALAMMMPGTTFECSGRKTRESAL